MTELIIIGLIIAGVLFFIGRSLWRAWNSSKTGCSGCCSNCSLGKTCNTMASGNIVVPEIKSAQSAGRAEEDQGQ